MATSFPAGGLAVICGLGGIGSAVLNALRESDRFAAAIGFGRRTAPPLELTDERSLAAVAEEIRRSAYPLRLVFDATGLLQDEALRPEKSLKAIDPEAMARSFAVNAIGPALLMKHLTPLFPRAGRSVFATLSAKVGSIGDNRLGGWYSYRAAKSALNQLVRTAAIELRRTHPEAVCVALHPGTVETPLSAPFRKPGLAVIRPADAARDLLATIDRLDPERSGGFFTRRGEPLPW